METAERIAELEKTPGAYQHPPQRRAGLPGTAPPTLRSPPRPSRASRASTSASSRAPGTSRSNPVIISQTGLSEMVYNDFFIGGTAMWTSWPAVASTTPAARPASTTACTPSTWAKTPRSAMWGATHGEGPGTRQAHHEPQTVVYLEEGPPSIWRAPRSAAWTPPSGRRKSWWGRASRPSSPRAAHPRGADRRRAIWEIILDGEGPTAGWCPARWPRTSPSRCSTPKVTGNARCFGHVQCDSIIMGDARISSIPAIVANHVGQAHSRGGHRTHRGRPDSSSS